LALIPFAHRPSTPRPQAIFNRAIWRYSQLASDGTLNRGKTMRMTTLLMLVVVTLVAGCGKQDDSAAKQAGKAVGKSVTDFASGLGKGMDSSLLVNVSAASEMEPQGLSITTAKWTTVEGNKKAISIYVISKNTFKGTLVAKAFSKEDKEIGRALADVDFGADDAKFTIFKFDEDTDTQLVDKYVVGIRK
jgi:hypothetical protein